MINKLLYSNNIWGTQKNLNDLASLQDQVRDSILESKLEKKFQEDLKVFLNHY